MFSAICVAPIDASDSGMTRRRLFRRALPNPMSATGASPLQAGRRRNRGQDRHGGRRATARQLPCCRPFGLTVPGRRRSDGPLRTRGWGLITGATQGVFLRILLGSFSDPSRNLYGSFSHPSRPGFPGNTRGANATAPTKGSSSAAGWDEPRLEWRRWPLRRAGPKGE